MARPDKAAAVAELTTAFRDSSAAVLTEYRGLTVAELKELRRSLAGNATYNVVKNTLSKIAAREAGLDIGRGIKVDDHMVTSDPDVLAVGECVEHDGNVYGLVAPLWDMCRSLADGLTDSPLGLAAWIIEKFHGWSGAAADAPPPFDRDRLITNVMLYWLGGINAANWLYWSVRHGGRFNLGRGERIAVPTGSDLCAAVSLRGS